MKTQEMHDKLNYPFRAWTIWLLSAIFMFYKYALEVSPSVMTSTLMTAFDISGVALGNLAACYFYAYLLLQIPAGLLLDRFGPRKTTTLAIALCAAGNLIFAGADSVFLAGIGRFLTGAGAAFAARCISRSREPPRAPALAARTRRRGESRGTRAPPPRSPGRYGAAAVPLSAARTEQTRSAVS